MEKIAIITGINGQLGQHLAKYLIENEPSVKIIGTQRHKSYGDDQPYIFDRSKVTMELMDLTDTHSIESLIVKYKPDYFINTAANAFVGDSWKVPAQHFEQNCLAVLHQLEAIRKHSPKTRYFNMGTSEEFGVSENTGKSQNEDTLIAPKSPYGASKAGARHIVDVWRDTYKLFAIQGWTFNFESEIRGEKYVTRKITKAVARIKKALLNNEEFEPLALGNINSCRSWQFAGDVADGIWKMLNQEKPNPYVLSETGTHTVRDFVEKAFQFAGLKNRIFWAGSGKEEVLIYTDLDDDSYPRHKIIMEIDPQFYRPLDVTYLNGDSARARKELNWSPKVSFDQLVERMVKHDIAELCE